MKSQLSYFQKGALDLSELVDELIFLRNALETCLIDWDLKFTEKLTDLETANSYMIEKGVDTTDATIQPIVESLPSILTYSL